MRIQCDTLKYARLLRKKGTVITVGLSLAAYLSALIHFNH